MAFERYSAVPIFGIPLEGYYEKDTSLALNLMRQYDVSPQPAPTDLTDLTPYYWDDPSARYFVSLAKDGRSMSMEVLSTDNGNNTVAFRSVAEGVVLGVPRPRTLKIPDMAPGIVIAGSSPRFAGKICVHELIVHRP